MQIKESYGQWKNRNSDRNAIGSIIFALVLCALILLYKYFILVPIKNHFKNRPHNKKTHVEKQIKTKRYISSQPETKEKVQNIPSQTIPVVSKTDSKQIKKQNYNYYDSEYYQQRQKIYEKEQQRLKEKELKQKAKENKKQEKLNRKLEKQKLREEKKQKHNVKDKELPVNEQENITDISE